MQVSTIHLKINYPFDETLLRLNKNLFCLFLFKLFLFLWLRIVFKFEISSDSEPRTGPTVSLRAQNKDHHPSVRVHIGLAPCGFHGNVSGWGRSPLCLYEAVSGLLFHLLCDVSITITNKGVIFYCFATFHVFIRTQGLPEVSPVWLISSLLLSAAVYLFFIGENNKETFIYFCGVWFVCVRMCWKRTRSEKWGAAAAPPPPLTHFLSPGSEEGEELWGQVQEEHDAGPRSWWYLQLDWTWWNLVSDWIGVQVSDCVLSSETPTAGYLLGSNWLSNPQQALT